MSLTLALPRQVSGLDSLYPLRSLGFCCQLHRPSPDPVPQTPSGKSLTDHARAAHLTLRLPASSSTISLYGRGGAIWNDNPGLRDGNSGRRLAYPRTPKFHRLNFSTDSSRLIVHPFYNLQHTSLFCITSSHIDCIKYTLIHHSDANRAN